MQSERGLRRMMFLLPVVATGLAAWAMRLYADDLGALWRDPYHDRNAHFSSALTIALALRTGDLAALLHEVARPSVWPPLQALLLGGWMAVAGPDLRWAVLPATLGWIGTMGGLAVLCRRAARDPVQALWAGNVAVALAATSPAFALLGADAMMETPGAALTVLVLATALARPVPWRLLAVLLTLLALHKYNYWVMVVVALPLAAPRDAMGWAWRLIGTVDRSRLTHDAPLRAGALVLAVTAVLLPVDPPWRVLGIQLLPGHVAALAWGLGLLAAARAWRRRGAAFDAALGDPARVLLAWHALPVALWLLVPGKLPALLWFLSPGHRGATVPHGLLEAITFHWQGFAEGFSPHPVVGAAILGLAALGAWCAPRLIVIFTGLGIAALLLHPQLQWRFQATVLPAVWALAGLGAARLLAPVRVPLAAVAVPLLLVVALRSLPMPALADAVAIRRPDLPRDLDLALAWRDLPVEPQGVIVLASIGRSELFDWTIRLRCRCLAPVDQPPWMEFGDAAAVAAMANSSAPWLLAVTMPAPYPIAGHTGPLALPVEPVLAAQSRYRREATHEGAAHAAQVAWWRAAAPPEGPPPPRRRGLIEVATGLLALATLLTVVWRRA
ncbi:hypothetical protein [Roseomonas fluvialis]|uniref:Glycosyltransferase RgtA/B/C/D-like domain-containing protein n=1 Tax=Roseomonas fluvialis TaxID=1750527 RepID=A0ABN6P102_9PROT|nr:hypothetical protein [Roseomonas fluvialis]BDG72346.1 hypothetical protein Rmf_22750 [Roseomonas fluvialis]